MTNFQERLGASHAMSLTEAVAHFKARAEAAEARAETAERRNLLNPQATEYVDALEARVAQLTGYKTGYEYRCQQLEARVAQLERERDEALESCAAAYDRSDAYADRVAELERERDVLEPPAGGLTGGPLSAALRRAEAVLAHPEPEEEQT